MNTCPGYRTLATTMQPATESMHHLQRENTEIETVLYLNYDTYSYGCQTYATTMQPATESITICGEKTEIDFAYLAKYDTCPGCWTLRRPSCNQPQKARAICRDREIGQHFAYIAKYDTCPRCWTLWRPSCNQPQKARTSYWKLKRELENYKDCSLVSVKTCLALSPC